MRLRLCEASDSPQGVETVSDSESPARLSKMSCREI